MDTLLEAAAGAPAGILSAMALAVVLTKRCGPSWAQRFIRHVFGAGAIVVVMALTIAAVIQVLDLPP